MGLLLRRREQLTNASAHATGQSCLSLQALCHPLHEVSHLRVRRVVAHALQQRAPTHAQRHTHNGQHTNNEHSLESGDEANHPSVRGQPAHAQPRSAALGAPVAWVRWSDAQHATSPVVSPLSPAQRRQHSIASRVRQRQADGSEGATAAARQMGGRGQSQQLLLRAQQGFESAHPVTNDAAAREKYCVVFFSPGRL